ncbi:ABC-three component system protein [Erysipelothrix rhusiopathiae]|uniref:ABC-three component system protein n=1 Tax=Erysipelothrix rhusiopathiae TaxID=1648 RepID=UPI002FBE3FF4
MNRSTYFNYIEEKLTILSIRIKNRGKLNFLEFNIHAENFYAYLMNILFDYSLINLNTLDQNAKAIDLIDGKNRIIIQVSSTCTKQKIENSLLNIDTTKYFGYQFKFVALNGDKSSVEDKKFSSVAGIQFDPKLDIYDTNSILRNIQSQTIEKQKQIYEFIKEELGSETDVIKIDSNLTEIINILSNEDLSSTYESPEINSFEIKRKIECNNLHNVSEFINENKIFYSKINEKYTEFDKLGSNKSFSVLRTIQGEYNRLCKEDLEEQDLFYNVIDNLIDKITKSKNYNGMAYEEMELCVSILVVDAFIKCKIFKNPEAYKHVIA